MVLGKPREVKADLSPNPPTPQLRKTTGLDSTPSQKMRRLSLSMLSVKFKASKSAMRRSTSLHAPKPAFRVQSVPTIVVGSPSLAHTPIHTPIHLNKPLPAIPDTHGAISGAKAGAVGADIHTDVSINEFEGYLDMPAYIDRKLPVIPSALESATGEVPSSPALSIGSPPKEDEWISSRCSSQTSTVFLNNDEVRRVRTQSGLLFRNSPAGRTVTPMSSLSSSESGLQISTRASLHTSVVTFKIDELSEPDITPCLTTKNYASPSPKQCCHCGRDPAKHDSQADSGPLPAIGAIDAAHIDSTPALTVLDTPKDERDWESKTTGPTITAEGKTSAEFVLYPETCYFVALDDSCGDASETSAGQTPQSTKMPPPDPLTSSPYTRPQNPDPYADENSPSYGGSSTYQRPSDPEPSPSETMSSTSDHSEREKDVGQDECDKEQEPSFWKDPAGTIVVFEGIARDGDEIFHGNDINYLGSFYDADEGSSGLGSTDDLVRVPSGLHTIQEDRSSEELAMWDHDVLKFF